MTVLHTSENHQHVLLFARQLDHHLRTEFFTGSWSKVSLQEAINKLKEDSALCRYWRKLLHKLLIPESQIRLSSQVLSAFVRKFAKRRCVTYLAKDGLAPKHEEDESTIRQMLKQINEKSNENKISKAQSTDTCFRCHKQGHWASECPEGYEPEWLAKQKCFLCGQHGHLKIACPKKSKNEGKLKTKIVQNKPPSVKSAWYQAGTSLTKLLNNLHVKGLDDFKCYKPISSETTSDSDDPKYYQQRSAKWFNARKGKINGSKAATALGWYGRKAMLDYWNDLSNDLHGSPKEAINESNLAMLWGSINEESTIVTYLKNIFVQSKDDCTVKETAIWLLTDDKNQKWLGSSPDGLIEENGEIKTVLEVHGRRTSSIQKCLY